MTLAVMHGWTPEQVDRMDPAFIDELMTYQTARQDHELLSADAKDDAELRKRQAKRRAELVKWRRG